MEQYSVFIFVAKFVICAGLLYYTIKAKKEKNLLKSTIISFIAIGILILTSFLISLANIFPNETPFYEVNFTEFLAVTLLINAFYTKH